MLLIASSAAAGGRSKIIRHKNAVPNSYIVVLDPATPTSKVEELSRELAKTHGARIEKLRGVEAIFKHAFKGFGAQLSDDAAGELAKDSRVLVVEQNAYVYPSAARQLTPLQWALDRIDQRGPVMSWSNTYLGDLLYTYQRDGSGVVVYFVDGGVQQSHPEFLPGQVLPGPVFSTDPYPATDPCGGSTSPWLIGDQQYWSMGTHGTAVASVIGGQTLGVAPGVLIVPIRVGNCNTYAELLWFCYGVNWIVTPPDPAAPTDIQRGNPYGRGVVNMSVFIDSADPWDTRGTPVSSFEWAVQQVAGANFVVVVSANNQSNSNCTTSPARLGNENFVPYHPDPWRGAAHRVISVGGTDQRDQVWRCTTWMDCSPFEPNAGSNTGSCVDLYAPAHDRLVAHFGSACVPGQPCYRPTGWPSSGTSLAAPAVAGYAARLLQANPSLSARDVWAQIKADATTLPPNFDGDGVPENDRILYAWPDR